MIFEPRTPLKGKKVFCVGFGLKKDSLYYIKKDLLELEALVEAAGGEVVGVSTQQLYQAQPSTCIGSGKVEELSLLLDSLKFDTLVIDARLSGVQFRNLEKELDIPVLDRSLVILDVFHQRAQTYEAKLQVELAYQLDLLPRMIGGWKGSLSRLAGGIGTRGPGESALEHDRRVSRTRITQIEKKLKDVKKSRATQRKRRQESLFQASLFGYTNAGKSSLLKALTKQDTFIKDQLFATLDALTKKIHLPKGTAATLTDTVGIINKLPPQLIHAFQSTLEESSYSDLLIHVLDGSDPDKLEHLKVIESIKADLKWNHDNEIYVLNKADLVPKDQRQLFHKKPYIWTSTKTLEGIEELRNLIEESLISNQLMDITVFIPKLQIFKWSHIKENSFQTIDAYQDEKGYYGTFKIKNRHLKFYKDFVV